MEVKVAKFGGSSLADASQFVKVRDILLADPQRRYAIPSAPGKRHARDKKITDMLYACHKAARAGEPSDDLFDEVAARYIRIAQDLRLTLDLQGELDTIRRNLAAYEAPDYAASRGEYLSGILLSAYLGWGFVDPAQGIFFDSRGWLDAERTQQALSALLRGHGHAVIPGFYGATPDGAVHTFSRGGSDITGAIVARAAQAALYENWTDVSGCLMADPRIVDNPLVINQISYRELRELSYMGATVLHEDALFPVRKAGIPTNIRNTNAPQVPGTLISYHPDPCADDRVITGIAGRKDFCVIAIEKTMMNAELGFGRRVLQALEELGISFEHLPTGIDTMCVVCNQQALAGKRARLVRRIYELTEPDTVEIHSEMALIATVGRGMVRSPGTSARLFSALSEAQVNVRMIDQGSSELNIIVGVDNADFERAVRAIYAAFVTP
ncbi:MAG: aspartate kinase [Oscillospiraceae bacterium]|jgi:aspartate kinase|nr:aspartate kinase [Oscillospiraceae bacterium]